MVSVNERIESAFDTLSAPVRWPLEQLGFQPTSFQVYLFLVGLLLLYLAWTASGGRWLLAPSRRGRAVGTVVEIDTRGDSPTPVIRFTDATGRDWQFNSDIPTNAQTARVGATVALSYDVGNPRLALEDGRVLYKSIVTLALLVFAAVVFGASLGLIPLGSG
jgi:hypothetical protein